MGIAAWIRNLFSGSAPGPPPRVPQGAPPRDDIEARLARSRVPGAALASIRDGQVEWVVGYGRCRQTRSGHYVTGDTVFQAASLSKPLTALAILGLVDDGRLDLDADVRPLIDLEIPEHPILQHHPRRDHRPITARLLLQHRGGIVGRATTPASTSAYLPADRGGGSLRFRQRRGLQLPTLEESWRGHEGRIGVKVTYPPGSQTSYSGAGFLVLQRLVEQVTGAAFVDHMDGFLATLGAKAATFGLRPPEHLPLARGHDRHGAELPGGYELVPWSAAGGLFTSAASLAEVLATVLRGGDDAVPAELIDEMMRTRLGVYVRRVDGRQLFLHGGDNGGYRAWFAGVRETGAGAVVLTNGRASDGRDLRIELARALLPAYDG